jgi:hypothetical protein
VIVHKAIAHSATALVVDLATVHKVVVSVVMVMHLVASVHLVIAHHGASATVHKVVVSVVMVMHLVASVHLVIAHHGASVTVHKVVASVVMVMHPVASVHLVIAHHATSVTAHKVAASVVMVTVHKVAASAVMATAHKVVASVVMATARKVVASVVMVTVRKVAASAVMAMRHAATVTTHRASVAIVHDHDAGSKSIKTGCGNCRTPFLCVTHQLHINMLRLCLRPQRQLRRLKRVRLRHGALSTLKTITHQLAKERITDLAIHVSMMLTLLVNPIDLIAFATRHIDILAQLNISLRTHDDGATIAPVTQAIRGKPVHAEVVGRAVVAYNRGIAEVL